VLGSRERTTDALPKVGGSLGFFLSSNNFESISAARRLGNVWVTKVSSEDKVIGDGLGSSLGVVVRVKFMAEGGGSRHLAAGLVRLEAAEFEKLAGSLDSLLPFQIESSNVLFQLAFKCVNWVKIPEEINREKV
jgi:hypothetical protein